LVAQTRHVRNADLGFAQNGLMLVPALGDAALDPGRRQRLLDAFRTVPGVTAAHEARCRFLVRQFLDAASPSNIGWL
ncbi:hypothetical protein, partial [Clostridium perfringens]